MPLSGLTFFSEKITFYLRHVRFGGNGVVIYIGILNTIIGPKPIRFVLFDRVGCDLGGIDWHSLCSPS